MSQLHRSLISSNWTRIPLYITVSNLGIKISVGTARSIPSRIFSPSFSNDSWQKINAKEESLQIAPDANLALELVKPIETPAVKPLDQKQILLSLLPDEFESKTLVAEAASQGISRATALRWNDEWQTVGLILKIKYGVYKKIA